VCVFSSQEQQDSSVPLSFKISLTPAIRYLAWLGRKQPRSHLLQQALKSTGATLKTWKACAAAPGQVRVSVVRLAPSVHGEGDHGFVPILINMAREKEVSAFVGNGLNRWPAVHKLDAARLFQLALEKADAGAYYHGVAEEGVAFRQIAEVIGRRLNVPVVTKSSEEAATHFAWFAHLAALDVPASSKQTQEKLGWHPTQPGLIADIDSPAYFKG
jgi:nucleoside-diphosphate-sugar epimerase